ncbi:MAG: HNH endonuclease [Muribaculaceae bacterium]|nr:HNH endonuclease [Muribaculaceae bacterium]
MKKLTEGELVLPVLAFLKVNGGSATIAEIKDYILATYPLSAADLKMSDTRKGEHVFEQQIRNLRSHDKLGKLGLAVGIPGGFRLLPGIADMLDDNPEWLFDMISSHTTKAVRKIVDKIDKTRKVISLDEDATEGVAMTAREAKRRKRSAKLRKAAVEHFSRDGVIACHCCGMTFEAVYGPEFGESCIEIHHKKPIYTYEDADVSKTIAEALKNVIPVCPNCHRVIHKQKLFSDAKIAALKKTLAH